MGMLGFGFNSGEVGLKVEGLQSSEHGVSRFADGVKSRTTAAGMLALQESPCLGGRTLFQSSLPGLPTKILRLMVRKSPCGEGR